MANQLKITLIKSTIRGTKVQRDTVTALGLRKLHQSVELQDNPAVRGMIFRVRHLVKVEEIAAGGQ